MHYTLLSYESPEDFSLRTDHIEAAVVIGKLVPHVLELRESGIVVSGSGIYPPKTATTLRRRDGEMLVQVGPITENKEQFCGFFHYRCRDLDTALEWVARCPSNTVELRRNLPQMK